MCNGFSGFYHRNGTVFFIEPNEYGNISHHDVLGRMQSQFKNNKDLVAFEFPKWTIKSFVWDHPGTIPDWADKDKCIRTFKLVEPVWLEYRKAREQAHAEYEKMCDQALTECMMACEQAHAEYKKVCDQVYLDYDKARDQALADYDSACNQARADMINNLSEIEGYLKEIQRKGY